MNSTKVYRQVFEGGNVFKGADKQPVTQRINLENIKPSVAMVEKILGFPLDGYLGTTGKKRSSGDIDISVDEAQHDKKEIATTLKNWAKENKLPPGDWVKLSGTNVHFKTPIRNDAGEHIGGYAQLDLMFGDPKFQAWSMRGEPGEYKGLHRHVIMANIAKANGMKWSYRDGLVNRSTGEIISQDPDTISAKLLPGATIKTFSSVENILDFLYNKFEGAELEKYIGEAHATLQQVYNVKLPSPSEDTLHENDDDVYFLAKVRDRIFASDGDVIMEDIIMEAVKKEKKLRDMNHIEDVVLEEGPKGLLKSIKILRSFADGHGQSGTSLKWDGSPAVYFGRNEKGEFMFTDKSGWSKVDGSGRATSVEMFKKMYANRKAPMDADRKKFVNGMIANYKAFEKATPKEFRGIMMGDLMWQSTPPLEKGAFVFEPNTVKYEVAAKSKLGKAIGNSKVGIVVHQYYGDSYTDVRAAVAAMEGNTVLVVPPVPVDTPATLNTGLVDKVEGFIKKNYKSIEQAWNPESLKGLSDVHTGLIYKYINNKVDVSLDDLGSDFSQWLNTQKLSDPKRKNLAEYLAINKKGISALFKSITGIMKLKDSLVREFDNHPRDIKQSMNGEHGGEGYVVQHGDGRPVKLVNRSGFTKANRAKHR